VTGGRRAASADRGGGSALVAALARLALVPLLLAGEVFEGPHSAPDLALAEPSLLAYALFAAGSLVVVRAVPRRVVEAPLAVADVLLLAVLVLEEGGAAADVRFALLVPVLVAAFAAGPRLTSVLAGLSLVAFLAAALASPTFGAEAPAHLVLVRSFDVAWHGALAITMSVLLARRSARIRELAEGRRSLVTQALAAEARARRELAYVLHDELVQGLLSARQDMKAVGRGRLDYLERADAAVAGVVAELRAEIFRLHPHELESAGLGPALAAVAAGQELAGGTRPVVAVTAAASAADVDHQLVFAVARELLTNAVRHADAGTVALSVDLGPDGVVVCCIDDGRGMPPGRPGEALADGHLGLASVTERVEAHGGRVEIRTAPDDGTQVRVIVPLRAEARSPEPPPVMRDAAVRGRPRAVRRV